MTKRRNAEIIFALCTGCALIAFAFYERMKPQGTVPAVAFYVAAAAICLLPVLYAILPHKICRN
jgi:hypothetical protein